MRAKIIGLFLTCILILLSFNCQEKKKPVQIEVQLAPVEKPMEGVPSVCIFDNSTVKSEPSQKGKLISTLAAGEKVIFLKQEKLDSADRNKKYIKIKLSDGKEGWALDNSLAVDAKPAVAICKTIIYLRPDLVTITNKEFLPMEFIAVTKPENEWCEAKGRELKKTGWIKSIYTSVKDEDITVALLANKALAETSKDKKKEKLNAIINNPSFSNSIFIDTLKTCLANIPPWDDDESSLDESEESEDSEEIE
jgi:hypothetical protein